MSDFNAGLEAAAKVAVQITDEDRTKSFEWLDGFNAGVCAMQAAILALRRPDARDDLVERLRIKADMILMGEGITWGSDSEVMREAATRIQQLETTLRETTLRESSQAWQKASQKLHRRAQAAEASLAEAERVMEIIAGRRQCIDNLMSNADVARAWLDSQSHLKDNK